MNNSLAFFEFSVLFLSVYTSLGKAGVTVNVFFFNEKVEYFMQNFIKITRFRKAKRIWTQTILRGFFVKQKIVKKSEGSKIFPKHFSNAN